MKRMNVKMYALFFFSIVQIAYELYVMRVFAIGSWSNFGSLVISMALLGTGIAGTILVFLKKRVMENPNKWLIAISIFFIPALPVCHILTQLIDFEPIFIGSDPKQILWIVMFYLIYGTLFFISSLYIGITFILLRNRIHKLYFVNMLGSGLGGGLILVLMFLLPPDRLLIPLIICASITALLTTLRFKEKYVYIPRKELIAFCICFAFSLPLAWYFGKINVSEYKSISYVQKYEDSQLVHHSYSPSGEFHVYSSSLFHSAPGMSDNAAANIDIIPQQAYWGLYIDGNGPVTIMGRPIKREKAFLDFLPNAAPYRIKTNPKVLQVHVGGGISTHAALHYGAEQVTIVEPNREIIDLFLEDDVIREFTGNFLEGQKVDYHIDEVRAYCRTQKNKFDIVELSLVDSIGLASAGGYPIHENYIYTREAMIEYINALTSDGVLAITVWNKLNPPRNVLKVLSTAVAAMKKMEMPQPDRHFFVFDYLNSTATVLVKKTPFTDVEIKRLTRFAYLMSFNTIYYPGIGEREKSFDDILRFYQSRFIPEVKFDEDTEMSFEPSDLYYFGFQDLLFNEGKRLENEYIFNTEPIIDDKPYYGASLKIDEIENYLDQLQDVAEEWGTLILIGIFLVSIVFGFLIILIPFFSRWKALFSRKKGNFGVILYFSFLGLGYMLIEIYLIQKLSFFLVNATYSASIVITSMLIVSAIGSLTSQYLAKTRQKTIQIAVIGIALSIFFYMFGLNSLLMTTQNQSFSLKVVLTVLIIFPSAYFMGMPFPNGLNSLTEKREDLLPWAWGMNGALSVTGSVLARIVSINWGFLVVLAFSLILYGSVAILYPANEGWPKRPA